MRMIDADVLKDKECAECDYKTGDDCRNQCGIMDRIDSIPTVFTHKTGYWRYIADVDRYICSNCKRSHDISNWYSNFCPYCGADMRGE